MKFSAHFVIPGDGSILPKGIVDVAPDGTILQLIATKYELREQAGMEFHSGLICPAFINLWQYGSTAEIFDKLPDLAPYRDFVPNNTADSKAVFNWIKAIQENLPDSSLPNLIQLFTAKAAQAFHLSEAGMIRVGKHPGLVLISGIDYTNFKLKADSKLRKFA